MIAGYPVDKLLTVVFAFVSVGGVLSWLICLLLRAVRPGLSRRAVMATIAVGVPVLIFLIMVLVERALNGELTLSFVQTLRWEGWASYLAAEVVALLLARRLAPAPPLKVDPLTFE